MLKSLLQYFKQRTDKNIWLYWAYSATPASFHEPIHIIYLTSLGIDFKNIIFIKSFGYILNALLEVPIGFISDRVERKWILALSSLTYLVAQIIYITITKDTYQWLYLSEVLIMLSTSLYSGTKSSIIADHLKGERRMKDFGIVQNTALTLMKISDILFVFIGGLAFMYSYKMPYFLNMSILFLGAFLIIMFREKHDFQEKVTFNVRKWLKPLMNDFGDIWVLIVPYGFTAATLTFLTISIQPYFQQTYNTDIKTMGFIYQLYILAGVIGGFFIVDKLRKRKNLKNISFVFFITGICFLLLSMNLALWQTLAVLILMRSIYGLQDIFFQNEIHYFADRSNRATLLSLVSVVRSLFRGLFFLAVYRLLAIDKADVKTVMFIIGIIYFIGISPLPFMFAKFYKKR